MKPEQLYTMLGFFDEDDATEATSVELAIRLDERLAPARRRR